MIYVQASESAVLAFCLFVNTFENFISSASFDYTEGVLPEMYEFYQHMGFVASRDSTILFLTFNTSVINRRKIAIALRGYDKKKRCH